jgi:protein-tyrosine phosphatase
MALAFLIGGAGRTLLWPAFSLSVVGVAYVLRRPALLGKQADGTLALWALPLLGPYFVLTWGLWHAERLLRREDAASEIAPGLWVGRRPLGHELPPGVRRVVDLTAEFAAVAEVRRQVGYLCVPVLDGTAPDLRTLRALVDRLRGEEGVLLHCASGHGRSAMVAAALLLDRGQSSDAVEAEARLRRCRPGIRLNATQREVLRAMVARPAFDR